MLYIPQQERTRDDEWFVALVQHSSDLIVVVDSAGVVVYANPAASVTFGVSLDDAIGTSAFRYIHPDDLQRVMARQVKLVQAPGTSMADSIRFVAATGEIRVLEIIATNCIDLPGVNGIVINGRDVTERNDYLAKAGGEFRRHLRRHGQRRRVAGSLHRWASARRGGHRHCHRGRTRSGR